MYQSVIEKGRIKPAKAQILLAYHKMLLVPMPPLLTKNVSSM
jgi:hypothetical protein